MIKIGKNFNIHSLYLFIFGAYCFWEILLSSEITSVINGQLFSLLKYFNAGLILFFTMYEILKRKFCIEKEFVIFSGLILVSIVTLYFAKSLHLFVLYCFMFLFRDIKFERIIKTSYRTLVFTFCFILLLALCNVIPNVRHVRNEDIRYALGFSTPTLGQSVFMFILLTRFYLKKNKVSYLTLLVELLLSYVLYKFTAGRTGFYLCILIIFVNFSSKFLRKYAKTLDKFFKNKVIRFLVIVLPIIFVLISLYFTRLYANGNSLAVSLNRLLSTRLELQDRAFKERSLTLFGANIQWVTSDGIYIGIDNAYLYYLFNYGIVNFIIILFLLSVSLKKSLKAKDYWLTVALILMMIDSLIEPYMIDFKYNCFILSLAVIFKVRYNYVPIKSKVSMAMEEIQNA